MEANNNKGEVVLLGFWASPYGVRVRMAMAMKEIDYDYKEENLQNKSHLLLQMNPVHKKIPVLIHNRKPVCESLLILEYIDEVWHHKCPLLPSDPYLRSQAKFWADYCDKKINPLGRKVCSTKGEEQETSKKELIEVFKVFEEQLGDKLYFGGDILGFLDATLLSYHCWFSSYELYGNFSMIVECPKIVLWAERCIENKCVFELIPEQKKVEEFFSGYWKSIRNE